MFFKKVPEKQWVYLSETPIPTVTLKAIRLTNGTEK